jgi:hypothetical protein
VRDLEELNRLYEAATPGEWRPSKAVNPLFHGLVASFGYDLQVIVPGHEYKPIWEEECHANTEVTAALHNAWPEIVVWVRDAVELLRSQMTFDGTDPLSVDIRALLSRLSPSEAHDA